ncbi:MAG: lipopolysaccharide biosynthesis protein [Bacteroidetes bacterium]|nr:lipopolysaccharide biosynthesis protein [Bacteroidota bacterium]
MKDLKQAAAKGFLWSSIERFSVQSVQFVIELFLARLLLPSDYGLIGMMAIFIAISHTFVNSGFVTALIQKKNRDELDYSTTFYFNLVVATFFYLVLFFASPLIAKFYNQTLLISLIRTMGGVIIINALSVVQRAKLTINFDFKTQTKASLISVLISGGLSIYLAILGWGVWSLIVLSLLKSIINTFILWIISGWIPRNGFSYSRFKELFSFGYKILLSGLLGTFFRNIYLLVIGKFFSANILGYYTRAQQFSNFPAINLTSILERIAFPTLSELQDNNEKLIFVYKKFMKMVSLVIFPVMIGLAVLASPLVNVILTEKWDGIVWMLQILSISMMTYPMSVISLSAINVKGRSDIYLKIEIIKRVLVALSLVITIPIGINAVVIGQLIISLSSMFINLYFTNKLIRFGILDLIKNLLPILLLSIIMGIVVHFSILFLTSLYLKLFIGISVGIVVYLSIAWISNLGDIREVKYIKKLIFRNSNEA